MGIAGSVKKIKKSVFLGKPGAKCNKIRWSLLTMSHIIDTVQISDALLVKHVLSLAPNDFQRIRLVEQSTRFAANKNTRLNPVRYLKSFIYC